MLVSQPDLKIDTSSYSRQNHNHSYIENKHSSLLPVISRKNNEQHKNDEQNIQSMSDLIALTKNRYQSETSLANIS